MSPRSNRPRRRGRPGDRRARGRGAPPRPGPAGVPGGLQQSRTVDADGITWQVRQVAGDTSPEAVARSYLCPGCQQQVAARSPHTVAWPEDAMQGLENRRHWHTGCWRARRRRHPGGAWA